MRRTTIVGIAVAVVIVSASAFMLYDLNGGSTDFSDREMRLIVTGSMDGGEKDFPIPTIPVNSMVMIEHLDEEELGRLVPGDVLAFDMGSMLVVHRIVSVDQDNRTFVTQGDANPSSETVAFYDAVGEVVGVSPFIGKLVQFVQENILFILAGLVALCGLAWSIRQVFPKKNQKEE